MTINHVRLIPAAVVVFCGCVTGTEPEIYPWEGRIVGSEVSGNVAVLSQFGRTEVSIQIAGAQPDASYAWRINEDTCAHEGALVGGAASYPALETDASGSAVQENTLPGMLRHGRAFAARVLDGASVVACGELEPAS
ncbi:MAG TPA: hypothetical protein VFU06_16840 [Longimicrobiales bacterium]|nr:hypothetical protein [Longimicrobiales bacterium]